MTKMQTNLVARTCVHACFVHLLTKSFAFFFFNISSVKTKAKFSIIFFHVKCLSKKVKVKSLKKVSENALATVIFFSSSTQYFPVLLLGYYARKIKASPFCELSSGRNSFSVVFAKGVCDCRLTSLNRSLGMWNPAELNK